jgi:hypothetical protein
VKVATLAAPVDYTSRDFASIRQDVIAAVQTALPTWSGDDPNDFLRILLEGVAFVGDLTNYYVDRIANESTLTTANSRSSLLKMARTFGYAPSGPIAASVILTLTNAGVSPVTVPAGTLFSGTYNNAGLQTSVNFETTDDVTITNGTTGTVNALEGLTQRGSSALQSNGDPTGVLLYRSDGLATSDGTPDQEFMINASPVIEGSTRVWVHPPASADGATYTYVSSLVTAGPNDRVYTLNRNADDSVTILFGDGANGYIPPSGYSIKATYRLGGGQQGNVPVSTVTVVKTTPTGGTLPTTLTVANLTPGAGGVDSESNDTIRRNAALSFRTRDRAISTQDYLDLAIRTSGVAHANALGNPLTNVVVYVAPYVSGLGDLQPGYVSLDYAVSSYSITSNVATVTATGHTYVAGQVVNIYGSTVTPINGVWTVASAATNTFTINVTNTNVGATSVSLTASVVGSETATFTAEKASALTVLQGASPAGTGVAVAGPVYTDMTVKVTATLLPQTRQTLGRTAVLAALTNAFDVSKRTFAETIYTSDVVAAALATEGVAAVQVTTFARSLDFSTAAAVSGSYTTYNLDQGVVTGAPYEILRMLNHNISVIVSGGIPDAA